MDRWEKWDRKVPRDLLDPLVFPDQRVKLAPKVCLESRVKLALLEPAVLV